MATVLEAVESGITFLDAAPGYGNGEAELVIEEAFNGQLPDGVQVSTKCRLGNPAPEQVLSILEGSLNESLTRMRLGRVDLFFLHNQIIPDNTTDRNQGTPRSLFTEAVRPALEQLVATGRIGGWGISVFLVRLSKPFQDDPPPGGQNAVQVVANLLDSPGGPMNQLDRGTS